MIGLIKDKLERHSQERPTRIWDSLGKRQTQQPSTDNSGVKVWSNGST